TDARVIEAEYAYHDALNAQKQADKQRLNIICTEEISNSAGTAVQIDIYSADCDEFRAREDAADDARKVAQAAAAAYGTVVTTVTDELITAGYMPAMDSLDAVRRPVAEMFVFTVGLFVPLTVTDLAIEAGTFGLGKIARVGKAI